MRKILCGILWLLLLPVLAVCADVTLQWDASPTPGVAGYEVYTMNFQQPYNFSNPACDVTGLSCVITVPDDRHTEFVARAYVWGPFDLQGNRTKIFSDNSNTDEYVPPGPTKPEPPLIVQIIAAIVRVVADFFA